MPTDADRAGTPAGVFGAELRYYRTRADLSQKDLAALVHVSNDVISKIETGERPPAEDFPPRLDAVPELDTRGALTRLWNHLKKGQKQRLYGWFQDWADIEAQATVLRWYEPLVVSDLDEQVAARLARQTILDRRLNPALSHPADPLHRSADSPAETWDPGPFTGQVERLGDRGRPVADAELGVNVQQVGLDHLARRTRPGGPRSRPTAVVVSILVIHVLTTSIGSCQLESPRSLPGCSTGSLSGRR